MITLTKIIHQTNKVKLFQRKSILVPAYHSDKAKHSLKGFALCSRLLIDRPARRTNSFFFQLPATLPTPILIAHAATHPFEANPRKNKQESISDIEMSG